MEAAWIWLIPLLPLLGAAANGFLHARTLRQRAAALAGFQGGDEKDLLAPTPPKVAADEKTSGALGTAAIVLSFGLACAAFFKLLGMPPEERALTASLGEWIRAGSLSVSWDLVLDPLSVVMTLVITGVGSLIHLYSVGYMHGDEGFSKYFAYLNLFVAMMLVLVLSESLLGLFLGWEGVGLCSYLLIGFWYQDGKKADAASKAFIVNRIGDFGFLVGMFLLFWNGAGTLGLGGVNAAAEAGSFSPAIATLAGLCLFLGCCGKSAQIPLYVWLPDAMAGPTPVSALIHAATMVTAGIYLIARLAPFFAVAPGVLTVIAVVGALTALLAASIAIAQRDIKKVLAYSTVSQLGYMFLALGVGAFSAGVFHLVTHAFFKALLFLGAGSVIHAMHERQDLFEMGGLRSRIPTTYRTFLVGSCALAGLPLFSGFFSKDEILYRVASGEHPYWALWAVGGLGAILTAVYTGRLVTLAFFGEPRFDEQKVPVHESPPTMTGPLVVLAFLSIAGGLLGIPFVMHPLENWLHPVVHEATVAVRGAGHGSAGLEIALMVLGGVVALGGLWFGVTRFARGVERQKARADAPEGFYRYPANAWFVDTLYQVGVVVPLKTLSLFSAAFDVLVIDGLVNFLAKRVRDLGGLMRRMQSGRTQDYALWLTFGSAAILLVFYLVGGRAS